MATGVGGMATGGGHGYRSGGAWLHEWGGGMATGVGRGHGYRRGAWLQEGGMATGVGLQEWGAWLQEGGSMVTGVGGMAT